MEYGIFFLCVSENQHLFSEYFKIKSFSHSKKKILLHYYNLSDSFEFIMIISHTVKPNSDIYENITKFKTVYENIL